MLDAENAFLTAGRDRTVKLWSVSHSVVAGDLAVTPLSVRRSYLGHRKAVFSVLHNAALGHVASSDGSVHVWDVTNGHSIRQWELGRSPAVALSALPNSQVYVAATSESNLRFLDARVGSSAKEWRTTALAHGTIRTIAVDPAGLWVAVGFASGMISLLDARTGLLLASWRAHDGAEITALRALPDNRFVSAGADASVLCWSLRNGGPEPTVAKVARLGVPEPVVAMAERGSDVVVASASKLGIFDHASGHQGHQAEPPARLRGLKGSVSAMAVLELNSMVLLGTDGGGLSLWH